MSAMQVQELDTRELVLGNVAGELALLGEILLDNRILDRVAERLHPRDFVDPLLGRVYEVILRENVAGRAVTPQTLTPFFADDPDFAQRQGAELLADAFLRAIGDDGRAFVDQIADFASRRRLISGLQEAIDLAKRIDNPQADIARRADLALSAFVDGNEEVVQHSALDCIDEVIESFDRPRRGIRCGVVSPLDDLLGPLHAGDLIVIAGRPGMGKTAVAISYLWGAASIGHAGLFVSAEMGWQQLGGRLVSDFCCGPQQSIPYQAISEGPISRDQRRIVMAARDKIAELPLKIADRRCNTLSQVRRAIRRRKRELEASGKRLEIVIVDYLQIITPDVRAKSEFEAVTEVSRSLKEMARNEGVAIIALAQLSRQVEQRQDKRPQLSDLRQSGQIEQDADAVVFLLSPEYYLLKSEPTGEPEKLEQWQDDLAKVRHRLEFICAKRRNGPEGVRAGLFFRETQAVRGPDFWENGGR